MTRITTIFVIGLNFILFQANGQVFKQQFDNLFLKKDTIKQRQLLEKWEKSNSNDPELYVAYFNYFVNQSMKEVVKLDKKVKGENTLKILDKDSSKKEPLAYMYGDTY